jgi:hypothetical protein
MSLSDATFFAQLEQTHHTLVRLNREQAATKKAFDALETEALQRICPFYSVPHSDRLIPLAQDRALVMPSLSLHFHQNPEDPNERPYWKASGQEVAFLMGRRQKIGKREITQAEFEALPAEIRSLTAEQMAEVDEPLIGMDKPLRLSSRQMKIFTHLATMPQSGQPAFQFQEKGQALPRAHLDSYSTTVDIWRSLVRRGVLTVVSGQHFGQWKVNPGPRFLEAIDLILVAETTDLTLAGQNIFHDRSFTRQQLLALRDSVFPSSTS